jgi:glycosyltransferase Alg8
VLDIYEPIFIKRSNISIKGDDTTLLSHIKGKDKAVVTIEGERGHYIGKTLESMDGKIHLKIHIKGTLNKKELLLIEEANDKHFVYDVLGSKKWYRKFPKLRSEIVEVAAFRDGMLTMPYYSKSMIDAKASIYTIKKVSNVTIQNITIDSVYKSKKYNYIYENSEPDIMVSGIKLFYASHIRLKNIQIYNSGSSPLVLERAYGCRIDDITIDGAINKGKKGNGYLRINKSFHNDFSNISVKHIRHITFQCSSAYNKIDGLYSEVDVNFHGGATHDNEVLNAVFNVDVKKHKWGKVYITPRNASWAPPDFKTNKVEEKL